MNWSCEAYGPRGEQVGAICFFGRYNVRDCTDEEQCHLRLAQERRRTFSRINELAAAGEPDMAYLAEIFSSPDQLLGGPDA